MSARTATGNAATRAFIVALISLVFLGVTLGLWLSARHPKATNAHVTDRLESESFYAPHANWVSLLQEIQSVARVRVDAMSEPYWNSADGMPWAGNQVVAPLLFTDVQATVEETWFGEELPTQFNFTTWGDARQRYEGSTIPPDDQISGGFTTGQDFIVLLKKVTVPFESGERSFWTLGAQFEGNWRVNGTQAIDSDLSRSAKLSALRTTLAAAWAEGRSR